MARSAPPTSTRCSPRSSMRAANTRCRLGNIEDHPYLKNQERLTFARCGITDPVSVADYVTHGGFEGLKKALSMAGAAIVTEVTESGLRGRGGAGFPTGIKWKTVHDAQGGPEIYLLQRRRGRQRHLRRPHGDGGRSPHAHRGHDHRRHRHRRHQGLRLYPLGISRCHRRHEGGDRRRHGGELAGRQYSGYGQILPPRGPPRRRRLYLRRGDRDAGKPRGQARHGAAASRRSRRSKACSASRPSSTTC